MPETSDPRHASTYRAARRPAAIKAAKERRKAARAAAVEARTGYTPKPKQGPHGKQIAANRRLNQAALVLHRKAA